MEPFVIQRSTLPFKVRSQTLRNNKKTNKSELWTHLSYREVCLTFSRLAAKLSEMIAKFQGRSLKIQHWSSFVLNGLKTALPYNSKIASNQCICSKDWWEVSIIIYRTKTKTPQQWGVVWVYLYSKMFPNFTSGGPVPETPRMCKSSNRDGDIETLASELALKNLA